MIISRWTLIVNKSIIDIEFNNSMIKGMSHLLVHRVLTDNEFLKLQDDYIKIRMLYVNAMHLSDQHMLRHNMRDLVSSLLNGEMNV